MSMVLESRVKLVKTAFLPRDYRRVGHARRHALLYLGLRSLPRGIQGRRIRRTRASPRRGQHRKYRAEPVHRPGRGLSYSRVEPSRHVLRDRVLCQLPRARRIVVGAEEHGLGPAVCGGQGGRGRLAESGVYYLKLQYVWWARVEMRDYSALSMDCDVPYSGSRLIAALTATAVWD